MGQAIVCAAQELERDLPPDLTQDERRYYRDQLRSARYEALADSEGFLSICFVLEDLGIRLLGIQKSIGGYQQVITHLVPKKSRRIAADLQHLFSPFSILYETVRNARNDAMHTGSYARHVTARAIELCILLEDCLMSSVDFLEKPVLNYMVREPTVLNELQPVARARQLMLTHSFSNIPVFTGDSWHLLSDISLSKYLESYFSGIQ
jgi:CBS domain-containing protein